MRYLYLILALSMFGPPAFAADPNPNPVQILSDDFESGDHSKWGECTHIIAKAPLPVHSGTFSSQYQNFPGCHSNIFSPPMREVYVSFWWFIPDGFDGGHMGGRHFWRFSGTDGGIIDTQAQSEPQGFSIIYFGDGAKFYPDIAQLPTGRWFHFESYTILNDPGVANGTAKLWIDGEAKIDDVNVNLAATSNSFNRFLLSTNYASCTGVCDWFQDDVEVWNGCPPGSSCAGPLPAILTPPSNLRVIQ